MTALFRKRVRFYHYVKRNSCSTTTIVSRGCHLIIRNDAARRKRERDVNCRRIMQILDMYNLRARCHLLTTQDRYTLRILRYCRGAMRANILPWKRILQFALQSCVKHNARRRSFKIFSSSRPASPLFRLFFPRQEEMKNSRGSRRNFA